jgi:hypothetical protein
MVPPSIFRHNYCSSYPLYTKLFLISQAPSRKGQVTVRFTGHSRTMSFQYAACFMVPFWRLEFGDGSYMCNNNLILIPICFLIEYKNWNKISTRKLVIPSPIHRLHTFLDTKLRKSMRSTFESLLCQSYYTRKTIIETSSSCSARDTPCRNMARYPDS